MVTASTTFRRIMVAAVFTLLTQTLPAVGPEVLRGQCFGETEFGQAISQSELGEVSGRQATEDRPFIQVGDLDATASIEGNILSGSSLTGMNQIGSQALSNVNGIATLIQNSGNQVLIQNSFILNMAVH